MADSDRTARTRSSAPEPRIRRRADTPSSEALAAQRTLAGSERVQSLVQLQQAMNRSPRVAVQAKLAEEINHRRATSQDVKPKDESRHTVHVAQGAAPIQLFKREFNKKLSDRVKELVKTGQFKKYKAKKNRPPLVRALWDLLKRKLGTDDEDEIKRNSTAEVFAGLDLTDIEGLAQTYLEKNKVQEKQKKQAIEKEIGKDDSSDEELSEDEDVHFIRETKEERPSAKTMTVKVGKERITGAELIVLAEDAVAEVIEEVAGKKDLPEYDQLMKLDKLGKSEDYLPQYDKTLGARVVESRSDWLKAAGTMDQFIDLGQRRPLHKGTAFQGMEHPIGSPTYGETGKLAVGKSRSEMNFDLNSLMVRVSPKGGQDLEYKDLANQLDALRTDEGPNKVTGPDIAQALLTLIESGELPKEHPLANEKALQLLHFTNTLGLGMEGSRLNANIFYHVSVLEDIAEQRLDLKKAFYEGKFGGVFPMATTGAEDNKGQLGTRRQELIASMKEWKENQKKKKDEKKIEEEKKGKKGRKRTIKDWEKVSTSRGLVGSVRGLRGANLKSNLVIVKEAQYLAILARRLRDDQDIKDKKKLEDALQDHIRNKMMHYFSDQYLGKDQDLESMIDQE